MNRCPVTYKEIPTGSRYSPEGLRSISRRLTGLQDFPYSAEEQRREAVTRASKMSIQGVQPKLSARLNVARESFEVVDTQGDYILKPQSQFNEAPENEDLTMHLAESAGIDVPFHCLVYSRDGSFTYCIKRFDRPSREAKLPLEDFAQLTNRTRDTKYDSSMEQVAQVIERYCTFPVVDKLKLFRRTLFSFLVGNEDMHLKNFSILSVDGKRELSPAYDLLNSTIALGSVTEEMALPIGGKKKNLSRRSLVDYYGLERLGLTSASIREVTTELDEVWAEWESLIAMSFLSPKMKDRYTQLVLARRQILEFKQNSSGDVPII